MTDWRDRILEEFTPGAAPLTVAADPDGVLLEPGLLEALRGKGFALLPFEDPVAFRFAYESRFRSRRDAGEADVPDVVVRTAERGAAELPHDLLRAARVLSFGLGELFPGLGYRAVAALDRGDLDALHRAWERHRPGPLGDDATADFALRHVFDIAPESAATDAGLLRLLLRRHYNRTRLPRLLDERLVRLLRRGGAFDSWPLESIVPDREAFLAFLQERWPPFLDRLAARAGARGFADPPDAYGFAIAGPAELPFDHGDVRVYLDTLFAEGVLRPVRHRAAGALRREWAAVGIRIDPGAERRRRARSLIAAAEKSLPAPGARYGEWTAFAWRWAELAAVLADAPAAARRELEPAAAETRATVDRAFAAWTERRYAGLADQPPSPPVMVHHVPRHLARRLADDPGARVALVVVDGLALEQWLALRGVLAEQRPRLRFREGAAFAWVPTITSVSRQAIFAGTPPFYFPASLLTTDGEARLWTRFWADRDVAAGGCGYARGLGGGGLDDVRALLARPGLRALGLVVDSVDKIMHGMTLGAAGMRSQTRQWAGEGFMARLLDALFDAGFSVFLTSDHGNVEAVGRGRPAEGAIAELRGERTRIYSDPALRARVRERFPDAAAWPGPGLPEECLALLAPGRSAFVREGERIVGHGGAALEEVVVPAVDIARAPA